jgi:hypothetical protein
MHVFFVRQWTYATLFFIGKLLVVNLLGGFGFVSSRDRALNLFYNTHSLEPRSSPVTYVS